MFVSKKRYRKAMEALDNLGELHAKTHETLTLLRLNCFITNEKGHRVRYLNASDAARAKAEGGKEQ
jgi:hypothetical protein